MISAFYLFVLFSCCSNEEGNYDILASDELFPLRYVFDNYIIKKPCSFLRHVRFGIYKSWFKKWIDYQGVIGSPDEEEQMRKDILKKVRKDCGRRYEDAMKEILYMLTDYEFK